MEEGFPEVSGIALGTKPFALLQVIDPQWTPNPTPGCQTLSQYIRKPSTMSSTLVTYQLNDPVDESRNERRQERLKMQVAGAERS